MSGVFICYRREDTSQAAGRLYDLLSTSLGQDHVFLDIDGIEPGANFRAVIRERVNVADAVFVLIGEKWVSSTSVTGERRIDNPRDSVRIEIEEAFALGKRIVPVLIDVARMPAEADLPDPLRPLAELNAVRLVHASFRRGTDELVAWFRRTTKSPNLAELKEKSPAESKAVPAARPSRRRLIQGLAIGLVGLAALAANVGAIVYVKWDDLTGAATHTSNIQEALCVRMTGKRDEATSAAIRDYLMGRRGPDTDNVALSPSEEAELLNAPSCRWQGFKNAFEMGRFGVPTFQVERIQDLQRALSDEVGPIAQTGKFDLATRTGIRKARAKLGIPPPSDEVDVSLYRRLAP